MVWNLSDHGVHVQQHYKQTLYILYNIAPLTSIVLRNAGLQMLSVCPIIDIILLTLLVLHISTAAQSLRMNRVVLVHLSNETDSRRLKIPEEKSATYGDLDSTLRHTLPMDYAAKIEYYSDVERSFKGCDPSEVISNKFISCYITIPMNKSEPVALIRGRAFNIERGFFIMGREINITDGSNRSLGTGLNTWDGAVVLAKFFEVNAYIVAGKRILELGSGTGVAGIAAGLCGAVMSVLTDLPYALDNLQLNIKRNIDEDSVNTRVFMRALDWGDPKTYFNPADVDRSTCAISEPPQWDIIIGADVVWVEDLVPLLVRALEALSGPDTLIMLAHQVCFGHCRVYDSCADVGWINCAASQSTHR